MTNQNEDRGSHLEALSVYAFMGAASMLFTLPVEAEAVYGLDTTSPDLIEEFADLIVQWVGYREVSDEGRIDSDLGRAARTAAQKHSPKRN